MDKKQQLQRWLEDHRGIIHRVVMLYGYSPSDREDLYQEIATALWQSMDRFEGRSAETTWIYRVALNTAISLKRKKVPDTEELTGEEPAPDAPQRDQLEWMYARLRTLNTVDRSLVLLYLDGNSYEDIAEVLGLSMSNVGVKITRIKSRLRELLQQEAAQENNHGS